MRNAPERPAIISAATAGPKGDWREPLLGLLADDAMRARLRDNTAELALKSETDEAAQAIVSMIRT